LDLIFLLSFVCGYRLRRYRETGQSFLFAFVDAVKQSHYFFKGQVDGGIARLMGFIFTPNALIRGFQKGRGLCALCKTRDAFESPAG